jgi:hypothetical protein
MGVPAANNDPELRVWLGCSGHCLLGEKTDIHRAILGIRMSSPAAKGGRGSIAQRLDAHFWSSSPQQELGEQQRV